MPNYDVLCIGNAIVDIIAQCDEAFLETNGIIKGAMNLIDTRRAELLYSRMGPAIEASGGSAGNTAAGVASFGGRAAFFGKVSNDALGEIYAHDIHAQGVAFDTKPLKGEPPTARSMIFVTPDGERSMNTYLGACIELGPEDVRGDETVVIKATAIKELVDTTGAGDLYAAGFLHGYTQGRDLQTCGDLGSLAAGLVIQQIGPRPRQNLRREAEQAGLTIPDVQTS
ncbi:MAG: adenosine kinase [Mesorhizobium sp.]|nr:MAG: adenosine kinase [Mesorhizobium sp.]